MRTLVHVGRILGSTLRFGLAGRGLTLVIAVVVGLILLLVVTTATVAAPVVFYPFA